MTLRSNMQRSIAAFALPLMAAGRSQSFAAWDRPHERTARLITVVNEEADWTYDCDTSPKYWAELGYPDCAGDSQSPINIPAAASDFFVVSSKEYPISSIVSPEASTWALSTGHNGGVQYNCAIASTCGTLTWKNKVYHLLQFHFHSKYCAIILRQLPSYQKRAIELGLFVCACLYVKCKLQLQENTPSTVSLSLCACTWFIKIWTTTLLPLFQSYSTAVL